MNKQTMVVQLIKQWWWAILLILFSLSGGLVYIFYNPSRHYTLHADCRRILYGVTQFYHCKPSTQFKERKKFDFCKIQPGELKQTKGFMVVSCGKALPEGGNGVLSPTVYMAINCDWQKTKKPYGFRCVKRQKKMEKRPN